MILSRLIAAATLSVAALPLPAHEFWIEPLRYQVEAGENLQADFKNGQEFEGTTLSYFDRSSARFEYWSDGTATTLMPRTGDRPALNLADENADGLVVVVHETTPSKLTYKEWAKFMKFAAHKDFPNAAADHEAAGWSKERFVESYTRHAKALFTVGDGDGQDQKTGMMTEFVALSNPYEGTFNNQMKVKLYHDGAPRPDAQVEVFDRSADGTVSISLHRTDDAGVATIPVSPGHDYLFDAVVLQPYPRQAEDDPVWQTLWAALTFAVPD